MKSIRVYFALAILLALSACFSAPQSNKYERGVPTGNNQASQQQKVDDSMPFGFNHHASQINAGRKIALLVPLSGRSQKIGQNIFDAAQMALYNSGNTEFQLIPFDTGETPDMAVAAAQSAAAQGAEVFLGPVFSDAVTAVAPIAREKNIKVFSFSNNKAVAGNGVYLLGLMPDQQIERIMQYAADRDIKGFSAVLPDNLFGNQVADIVRKQSAWRSASIRKLHFYPPAQPDFSLAAKSISDAFKERNVLPARSSEAMLIPEAGYNLEQIYAALSSNGFNSGSVRLLGSELWDDEAVIRNGSLNGAWYVAPPYEDFDPFKQSFQGIFNYQPERIAALGYDAVNLALELAESDFATADIHRSRGFDGLRGAYRFDAKGISHRVYAVYELRDGSAHVIDAAPSGFGY